MKRLLMVRKRIKGETFERVNAEMDRRQRGVSVRETTRIHALTGVPWEVINREAEKDERI